jgi:nucleoside-triphosphatase THEP1
LVIRENNTIITNNIFATKVKNEGFNERVGKWFVNSSIFDNYAVPIINTIINTIINKINSMNNNDNFLFVIDELGKMQSTSEMYVNAIKNLFDAIENNKQKNFIGIFVVPTDNSKWIGLDKLKNKYETFNINFNTRKKDQTNFITMILNKNM